MIRCGEAAAAVGARASVTAASNAVGRGMPSV
jgi:hypothetical protein